MNMPGFSAEVSLYTEPQNHYRAMAQFSPTAVRVAMQQCDPGDIRCYKCLYRCTHGSGKYACTEYCQAFGLGNNCVSNCMHNSSIKKKACELACE
jgi:hypothetical protein